MSRISITRIILAGIALDFCLSSLVFFSFAETRVIQAYWERMAVAMSVRAISGVYVGWRLKSPKTVHFISFGGLALLALNVLPNVLLGRGFHSLDVGLMVVFIAIGMSGVLLGGRLPLVGRREGDSAT